MYLEKGTGLVPYSISVMDVEALIVSVIFCPLSQTMGIVIALEGLC